MSLLATWLASPPPDAAVEIAPERVSAAAVVPGRGSRGAGLAFQAHAVESLPPGAVVPSLTSQNILDPTTVAAAVRTVLGRLGTRPARVALIIPDLASKVSILKFDQVPGRREDLDQLVRWQLKKSAPFPIDDACITYTPGIREASGAAEFVVAVARRAAIEEYEKACAAAGVYAGLVDLAVRRAAANGPAAERASAGGAGVPQTLVTFDRVRHAWSALVERTKELSVGKAAQLADAEPVAMEGTVVVIGFADEFARVLWQDKRRPELEEQLSALVGASVRVRCVKQQAPVGATPALEDPMLRAALETFRRPDRILEVE